MWGKLTFMAGLGAGFLAGSRQGRAPYEKVTALVRQQTGVDPVAPAPVATPTGEPPLI